MTLSLAETAQQRGGQSPISMTPAALLKQHRRISSRPPSSATIPRCWHRIRRPRRPRRRRSCRTPGLVGDSRRRLHRAVSWSWPTSIKAGDRRRHLPSIKTISDYLREPSGQAPVRSCRRRISSRPRRRASSAVRLWPGAGGDADALGLITKYADTLLNQARELLRRLSSEASCRHLSGR